MQEMLLGLVRVVPDAFGAWGRGAERGACHLRAHEALNGVKARAGGPPFILAVPRESFPQHLGHAPSVRVPESREHRPRRRHPERLNQLFSQQPERDGVQEKHALAGERDDSALWQEVKQLVNIQVRRAHEASVELIFKVRVKTIILIANSVEAGCTMPCK